MSRRLHHFDPHLPSAPPIFGNAAGGRARRGLTSLHAPLRISPGRPHCVIPDRSGAVTGREYHCPLRLSLHSGGCCPPFETRHCRSPEGSWRIVSHAHVLPIPERKYLQNVYSLVQVQGKEIPLHK